ncbi:hypothetical protein UXN85_20745 [Enterobacter hormaechei]
MSDKTPRKPIYDRQLEAVRHVMYSYFAECIMPDMEHTGDTIYALWTDKAGESHRDFIYSGPRHTELLAFCEAERQEMFDDWEAEEAASGK